MSQPYLLCGLALFGVALIVLCATISYQHEQIRQKIVERAKQAGCSDIKKLEDALDEMLGPAVRSFCAANDAEFQKQLEQIMSAE